MPNFSTSLLGLTLISGLATAFINQDRRGLSFFTEPEAFLVEEMVKPEPTSFPVEWGQSPATLSLAPRPRRSEEQFRSRKPVQQTAQALQPFMPSPSTERSTPTVNSPPPDAPTSVSPVRTASISSAAQPAPAPAASGQTIAPTIQPVPNGLTLVPLDSLPLGSGLTGGNLIRVGTDSELDFPDNTTTPDPVVPAVPEPSSWILMIIGVGLLGIMLRLRREEDIEGEIIFPQQYMVA